MSISSSPAASRHCLLPVFLIFCYKETKTHWSISSFTSCVTWCRCHFPQICFTVTQKNDTFSPEDILFEPVTCPPRYWSYHKTDNNATSLARTCWITSCLWVLTFPLPKESLTPLLRHFTMFILVYTCLQQNWVSVCFSRRCIQKRKNQEVEADAAVSAHQPLWRAATDHGWVGSTYPPGGTGCLRLAAFSQISEFSELIFRKKPYKRAVAPSRHPVSYTNLAAPSQDLHIITIFS